MATTLGDLKIDLLLETKNLRKSVNQATKELSKVNKAVRRQQKAFKDANKATTRYAKSLTTMFKASVIAGATAFSAALYKISSNGFIYTKSMEDARASLEAMIKSSVGYTDASGKQVSAMERQAAVNRMVGETFDEIQKILPETAMQMDGLIANFALMKPAADQAGASMKDQVRILKLVSNAATNFKMSSREMATGIDDLYRGTIKSTSAFGKMMTSLGVSNEAIKNAGNVTEYLSDKLREAGVMADTFEVAASNLKEAWDVLTARLVAPLWEPLKEAIKQTSHELGVNGVLATQSFGKAFIEFGKMAANVVAVVLKAVVHLIGAISTAWDGFKAIGIKAMQVWTDLKKVGNTVGKTVDFMFNGYKNAAKYDADMNRLKETSKAWGKEMDKVGQSVNGKMTKVNQLTGVIDRINDSFQSATFEAKEYVKSDTVLQSSIAKTADATKKATGATKKATKASKARAKAVEDEAEKLKKLKQEMKDQWLNNVATTIGDGIGDALLSVTDKTIKFGDAMRNTLNSIAQQIMQTFVSNKISNFFASMLGSTAMPFKGFDLFANGGIVNGPTVVGPHAIAGEAGPEAIMPVKMIGGDLGVKVEQAPINVNVINNGGQPVDIQQNGSDIDVIIGTIANQVQRGTGVLGNAFEKRYGLQKR